MGHRRADMASEAFADTNACDGGFVGNLGEKELAQSCGAVPARFGCEFAVGIGDFGDISGEEHSVIRPFGSEVDEENEDIGERGSFFVFLLLCEEEIFETDCVWWAGREHVTNETMCMLFMFLGSVFHGQTDERPPCLEASLWGFPRSVEQRIAEQDSV